MSSNRQKIFHLEIEGEHYYFGSPKAMFDTMGEERLHMKYASFHSNITLKVGDVYTNRRNGWIVRVGELAQAKTNRGNRWHDIIEAGIASALATRGAEEPQVASQPVEQAAEPVVETVEAPVVQAEVAQPAEQPVQEEPVRRPASRSKKKNADIPEQLTLF